MLVEITIAVVIWLVVILVTPTNLKAFFAIVSGGVIFLLLFLSILSPKKELLVYIPGSNGEPGYEVPFEEFLALVQNSPEAEGLILLPEIESLKSLNKEVLMAEDLSADQLNALASQTEFSSFSSGKKGLVIRHVEASIQNGKVIPAYDGVEFSNLPLLDDLQLKQKELENTKKTLNNTKEDLNRKQKVLEAIREIVEEKPKNNRGS